MYITDMYRCTVHASTRGMRGTILEYTFTPCLKVENNAIIEPRYNTLLYYYFQYRNTPNEKISWCVLFSWNKPHKITHPCFLRQFRAVYINFTPFPPTSDHIRHLLISDVSFSCQPTGALNYAHNVSKLWLLRELWYGLPLKNRFCNRQGCASDSDNNSTHHRVHISDIIIPKPTKTQCNIHQPFLNRLWTPITVLLFPIFCMCCFAVSRKSHSLTIMNHNYLYIQKDDS